MNEYEIQTDHPRIKSYIKELNKGGSLSGEMKNTADQFARMLRYFAGQIGWTFIEKFPVPAGRHVIAVDGVLLDSLNLIQGIWVHLPDDCDRKTAILEQKAKGIPTNNILFQQTGCLVLWRRGKKMIDLRVSSPRDIASVLTTFFRSPYRNYIDLEPLAERVRMEGPLIARAWVDSVKNESLKNDSFKQALKKLKQNFQSLDQSDLSSESFGNMIVKYLLIRRLCDKIFRRSSYITSSLLSAEIEKVLTHAPSQRVSPALVKDLEPVLRQVASQLTTNNEKLFLLEAVLAKFFPRNQKRKTEIYNRSISHEILSNLCAGSLEFIFKNEFNQDLADKDIEILDPFCHNGTYLRQILIRLNPKDGQRKYKNELYGNATDLLSYFMSLINIENTYIELNGHYQSFPGLNVMDTFTLTDDEDLSLYDDENSLKIDKLKHIPFNVVVGEAPISGRKVPSRMSRSYSTIDKRVMMTYGRASKARNKTVLTDTYVRTIRWASDTIKRKKEGIICLVCKNNFVEDLAFDGFRHHLARDFDAVFVLDIGNNENNQYSHYFETNRALLILVKKKDFSRPGIHYYRVGWDILMDTSFDPQFDLYKCFPWRKIQPDKQNTWLTEGLQKDFEKYLPVGTKISKTGRGNAIFRVYGRGLATSRDAWIYNFNRDYLANNIQDMIRIYNKHVQAWIQLPSKPQIESYLNDSTSNIPWSESLKNYLKRQIRLRFRVAALREANYRPFVRKFVYFDQYLVERWYQLPHMLPTERNEKENRLICVSSPGSKHFSCLMANRIPDLNLFAGASPIQCFPLYHYDNDGKNRTQNVSKWALEKFIEYYHDDSITKYDIFHYIYALLHHPSFLRKYAANLKKELPRIPFVNSYLAMVEAGKNLARIHLYYDGQEEYPLKISASFGRKQDWRIEKILLSEDRGSIILNDNLVLSNIPSHAFNYLIGNRSALEWMVDQYRLKLPFPSGQADDPNMSDDPTSIVRLIGQLITVSLKSVRIIEGMPGWEGTGETRFIGKG